MAITKVKGHATAEHVANGAATPFQRKHNVAVHALADKGRLLRGDVKPIWEWITKQDDKCLAFVIKVQLMMATILRKINKLEHDPFVRSRPKRISAVAARPVQLDGFEFLPLYQRELAY